MFKVFSIMAYIIAGIIALILAAVGFILYRGRSPEEEPGADLMDEHGFFKETTKKDLDDEFLSREIQDAVQGTNSFDTYTGDETYDYRSPEDEIADDLLAREILSAKRSAEGSNHECDVYSTEPQTNKVSNSSGDRLSYEQLLAECQDEDGDPFAEIPANAPAYIDHSKS